MPRRRHHHHRQATQHPDACLDDENLVLLGAGALAREMRYHMRAAGHRGVIWLCGDRADEAEAQVTFDKLHTLPRPYGRPFRWLCAAGSPAAKREMALTAGLAGVKGAPTYVHPLAYIADREKTVLAHGGFVAPGAMITTGVKIGIGVLLNLGVTVGHDTHIGDFCTINPNAAVSGRVIMGSDVLVGAGASIRESLTVYHNATIGMGSAVVKEVPPHTTVVGVPAVPLVRSAPTPTPKIK